MSLTYKIHFPTFAVGCHDNFEGRQGYYMETVIADLPEVEAVLLTAMEVLEAEVALQHRNYSRCIRVHYGRVIDKFPSWLISKWYTLVADIYVCT